MDLDKRTIDPAFYEEHSKQRCRLSMVQQDVKGIKAYERWQELNS